MIFAFEDNSEDIIELFDNIYYALFVLILVYIIYKHSTHFLTFLDGRSRKYKTVWGVIRQCFDDIVNIGAIALRFLTIVFRVNVYDTLDDFFDSYYIFVEDFEDSDTISLLYSTFQSNNGFGKNLNDTSESFHGINISPDLYYIYFSI